LKEGDNRSRRGNDDGAEIWDAIEDACHRAPERGLLQPNRPECNPRCNSDDHAGDDADEEKPGDLVIDLVEDLNGDFLLLQRRPGQLDEFAFEKITGREQEENKEEKIIVGAPLTSSEQFLKIVEKYPLVKELKDKLRLELDY